MAPPDTAPLAGARPPADAPRRLDGWDETSDTVRDCGEAAPDGLALIGETHLLRAALVDVAETRREGDGG